MWHAVKASAALAFSQPFKDDIEGTLRSQKNEYDIGAYLFNGKSQLGPSNLRKVEIN